MTVMDKRLLLLLGALCLAGCARSGNPKATQEPIFTEEANAPAAAEITTAHVTSTVEPSKRIVSTPTPTAASNEKRYCFKYKDKKISVEEDLVSVLGSLGEAMQEEEVESRAFVGIERIYKYDGLVMVTYPGDTKDYIESFTITSQDIMTAEGIKVGAELSELKKAYGDKLEEGKNDIYTCKIENTELRFVMLDGKVAAINLYSPVKNKKLMKDKEEPVLGNTFEVTLYTDQEIEQVDFLKYVTAKDLVDSYPTVIADFSKIKINTPGEYEVIFYAYDRAGNKSMHTTVYTVADKEASYTEPAKVDELADKVVSKIIKKGMSTPEKCTAIYEWVRNNFSYSESSDKLDWVQAANRGLRRKSGDCFVYYSVAQELLYRSGVISRRVQREAGHQSTHFWNLVYVPDQGWYHFDSTPRVGGGDDFNLVTDEWLTNYSENHDNSHAFNKELYPNTPNRVVKR